MDAKTIVAVVLVAFIIGGFLFLQKKNRKNKKQNGGRSVKNSVHLLYGGAL